MKTKMLRRIISVICAVGISASCATGLVGAAPPKKEVGSSRNSKDNEKIIGNFIDNIISGAKAEREKEVKAKLNERLKEKAEKAEKAKLNERLKEEAEKAEKAEKLKKIVTQYKEKLEQQPKSEAKSEKREQAESKLMEMLKEKAKVNAEKKAKEIEAEAKVKAEKDARIKEKISERLKAIKNAKATLMEKLKKEKRAKVIAEKKAKLIERSKAYMAKLKEEKRAKAEVKKVESDFINNIIEDDNLKLPLSNIYDKMIQTRNEVSEREIANIRKDIKEYPNRVSGVKAKKIISQIKKECEEEIKKMSKMSKMAENIVFKNQDAEWNKEWRNRFLSLVEDVKVNGNKLKRELDEQLGQKKDIEGRLSSDQREQYMTFWTERKFGESCLEGFNKSDKKELDKAKLKALFELKNVLKEESEDLKISNQIQGEVNEEADILVYDIFTNVEKVCRDEEEIKRFKKGLNDRFACNRQFVRNLKNKRILAH